MLVVFPCPFVHACLSLKMQPRNDWLNCPAQGMGSEPPKCRRLHPVAFWWLGFGKVKALPRQTKPLPHGFWRRTWSKCHFPWHVKSTIRIPELPQHKPGSPCENWYLPTTSQLHFFALHNPCSGPFDTTHWECHRMIACTHQFTFLMCWDFLLKPLLFRSSMPLQSINCRLLDHRTSHTVLGSQNEQQAKLNTNGALYGT